MKRGEIWMVTLGPAKGHEPMGHRPVVIVSPDAFNRVTKLPVVVPITNGGGFARSAGFAVSLNGSGVGTTGVIRCDQPRVLDVTAGGGRRIESAPADIVEEVLAKLAPIFE